MRSLGLLFFTALLYTAKLTSWHNFTRLLLFNVSKNKLRSNNIWPESNSFCRNALPLLCCEMIRNSPVSIHFWSGKTLHFRFDLHLSISPSNGSINLANTDFDVGFFEVIKIFSNPTLKSSFNCFIFDYFVIFQKIYLPRTPFILHFYRSLSVRFNNIISQFFLWNFGHRWDRTTVSKILS